ncbi:hypothetical protein [Nocardioides mangrovi]|uniref:Uncharacterized protein n=1 Tax=Nocardioides mangrovi TaxID=2874580 RepID=A0ABS7U855_9ACTN|nr:hypothetical protein [Nocardioides mangrovi]MBZ5736842.1 hypothetical protein [Nocardioides mangrovi]
MNVTFWIIAAVVLVVGFALAWWSSGRQRRHAVDSERARMGIGRSQADALTESNRPAGQGPVFGGPLG